MKETDKLIDVSIDDTCLAVATPEIEQERRVAIFDLLKQNKFALQPRSGRIPPVGPYKLNLSAREGRAVFHVGTASEEVAAEFHLSMSPFADVIKDYFAICASYFDAVKNLPRSRIEAIDMGRRGIHNEGARLVKERLESKAVVDDPTARRLFTLICVLQSER